MRRPSFCLEVRFGPSKLTSQLRKGEIARVFLLACNFTDVLLLSLNSVWFAGKGLTGIGLFLADPIVMRPCDGMSAWSVEIAEHNQIFPNKTAGRSVVAIQCGRHV